jgi:hypothetical protein
VLRARTWFRLAVPWPRAHVAVFSAGPVPTGGGVDAMRTAAERTLNDLCERADAYLYLRRAPPRGVRLVRAV